MEAWETFTISIVAPSGNDDNPDKLMEATNRMEEELRAIVNKYNGQHGMEIMMTNNAQE